MGPIEFVTYELPVRAGILAVSPMPGRTRHYNADWQRLIAWNPSLVISMTQQAELDRIGAGTFGQDLRNEGVEWLHLPVIDFGVPGVMNWDDVRDRVLADLDHGGRVLVHCYGGCGRSGMMALRLMIAAGEDADAALARLRQIRPCAVETEVQMAWALLG